MFGPVSTSGSFSGFVAKMACGSLGISGVALILTAGVHADNAPRPGSSRDALEGGRGALRLQFADERVRRPGDLR